MTIKANELKNFRCRYHRNGVAGAGFYACSFLYRAQPMRAVVFETDDNERPEFAGFYAVTSDSVEERWRGDHFIGALRELITASNESGESFRWPSGAMVE